MTTDEIADFASRYIDEMKDSTSSETQMWQRLDEMIGNDADLAWQVLLSIVEQAPGTFLNQIGAGPLETLLFDRNDLVQRAVPLARANAKFRETFRYVRGVDIPAQLLDEYLDLWKGDTAR